MPDNIGMPSKSHQQKKQDSSHTELNLLEKTELWVEGITLLDVNLGEVAAAAANVLDLPQEEVLVVDVRETTLTLDILSRSVRADCVAGREEELLKKIALVKGVTLTPDARVHSEGILGLLALPKEHVSETLGRMEEMSGNIRNVMRHRVKVFPSGFEVIQGLIKDTNSPFICETLHAEGYSAQVGRALPDHAGEIAAKLMGAVEEGFGLIITTGGVGAEDKDHTVEGILMLDPDAATPWLVKYQKGTGRHVKDGVRIAVAQVGSSTIIALPGPNDEVQVGLTTIMEAMPYSSGKEELAGRIASALVGILQEKACIHKCGSVHPGHKTVKRD